jgi:hypothetical protein
VSVIVHHFTFVTRTYPFLRRLATVNEQEIMSLVEDTSPHKYPPAGIQVNVKNQGNVNYGALTVQLLSHDVPSAGPSAVLLETVVFQQIVLPPILSMTIMAVVFPSGEASSLIGKPVSSFSTFGPNTTFQVTPTTDQMAYNVVLNWYAPGFTFYPTYDWEYNY